MHRAWIVAIAMVLTAAGSAWAEVADGPEIPPGAMPYLLTGAAGAVFYLRRFLNR